MSRTIQCCLLRPDAVRAAIGSNDRVLRDRAPIRLQDASQRRAAIALIEADARPGADGLLGLPGLCALLGATWLPNDAWAPYRIATLEVVDEALAAAGAAGRIADLVADPTQRLRGFDLDPEVRIAGWAGDEVAALRAGFDGHAELDDGVREAVAQVVGWLDAALEARTGLLLIDG